MRLWIKDPLAILAAGAERGDRRRGGEDRRMRRAWPIARNSPCDATFDASRHVVLPGLVNAHHHFYQTLTRAHPAGLGKELIPWLVAMERVWGRMTPEALRIAVRMALVELLLSGCTTAADHHNLFPPGLENAIDIEVEEATKLGMRMTVDARLDGHFGEGRRPAAGLDRAGFGHDPQGQRARARALSRSPSRRDDPRRARALFAARGAEAGDGRIGRARRALRRPAALPPLPVARRGRLRHAGVRQALGRYSGGGRMAHARAPGSRTASISTPARSSGSAAPASGVCHCAASDMAFGMGICPTVELEAAGVAIGLGVDGSASNDSSNMMEAVRHSLMLQRLRYGPSAVTPYDALRWGTEGSARCLGRDDIGAIALGMQADLALFTLDEPRFSGAHDPIAALALCGAHRADRVMVAGRWRVIDGAPEGVDLAALIAKHKAAARAFA